MQYVAQAAWTAKQMIMNRHYILYHSRHTGWYIFIFSRIPWAIHVFSRMWLNWKSQKITLGYIILVKPCFFLGLTYTWSLSVYNYTDIYGTTPNKNSLGMSATSTALSSIKQKSVGVFPMHTNTQNLRMHYLNTAMNTWAQNRLLWSNTNSHNNTMIVQLHNHKNTTGFVLYLDCLVSPVEVWG